LNIGSKILQHNPIGIDLITKLIKLLNLKKQIKIAIQHVVIERITKHEPQD